MRVAFFVSSFLFSVCFSCSAVIPSHLQREHPMATPGQIALTAPHPARDSADTEAPPRLKSAALVEQGNNFWHIERSLVDEPTRWLQAFLLFLLSFFNW